MAGWLSNQATPLHEEESLQEGTPCSLRDEAHRGAVVGRDAFRVVVVQRDPQDEGCLVDGHEEEVRREDVEPCHEREDEDASVAGEVEELRHPL